MDKPTAQQKLNELTQQFDQVKKEQDNFQAQADERGVELNRLQGEYRVYLAISSEPDDNEIVETDPALTIKAVPKKEKTSGK